MKKILFGLLAIGIVVTGCNNDQQNQQPLPEGEGALTVRLVNPPSKTGTRANQLALSAALTEAAEMDIKSYTIYVFDEDSNTLEKKVTVENPADGEITTITGLISTTTKTVAVIANNHEYVDVPTFTTNDYNEFNTTFMSINDQPSDPLETQANGLVMTGKVSGVTITPKTVTTVTVPIERVVAKVLLRKVTLDRSLDLEQLASFDINGVSMQRVLSASTVGPLDTEIKAQATPTYVGGLVGSISSSGGGAIGSNSSSTTLRDMNSFLVQILNGAVGAVQETLTVIPGMTSNILQLVDAIAGNIVLGGLVDAALLTINGLIEGVVATLLGTTEGISDLVSFTLETGLVFQMNEYFYVMPNNPGMFADPANFQSTLLTLSVTYDGTDYYYPIEINSPDYVDVGSNTANGKYIERNTEYIIDLNIRSLMGNDDPDQPAKPGMLEVTVTPLDWRGPIVQSVNW